MKMKKRFLSFFLMCLMVLSIFPVGNVFAAGKDITNDLSATFTQVTQDGRKLSVKLIPKSGEYVQIKKGDQFSLDVYGISELSGLSEIKIGGEVVAKQIRNDWSLLPDAIGIENGKKYSYSFYSGTTVFEFVKDLNLKDLNFETLVGFPVFLRPNGPIVDFSVNFKIGLKGTSLNSFTAEAPTAGWYDAIYLTQTLDNPSLMQVQQFLNFQYKLKKGDRMTFKSDDMIFSAYEVGDIRTCVLQHAAYHTGSTYNLPSNYVVWGNYVENVDGTKDKQYAVRFKIVDVKNNSVTYELIDDMPSENDTFRFHLDFPLKKSSFSKVDPNAPSGKYDTTSTIERTFTHYRGGEPYQLDFYRQYTEGGGTLVALQKIIIKTSWEKDPIDFEVLNDTGKAVHKATIKPGETVMTDFLPEGHYSVKAQNTKSGRIFGGEVDLLENKDATVTLRGVPYGGVKLTLPEKYMDGSAYVTNPPQVNDTPLTFDKDSGLWDSGLTAMPGPTNVTITTSKGQTFVIPVTIPEGKYVELKPIVKEEDFSRPDREYTSSIEENPNEYEDYRKVKQEGKQGVCEGKKVIYTLNDKVILEGERITKDIKTVDEIIEIGTKPINTEEEKSYLEEIPFEEKTEEDPTLKKGETKIKQEGKAGKASVTEKIYYNKGEKVKSEILSRDVLMEPVDEITLVGTLEYVDKERFEDLPFETEYMEDPEMAKDEEKVVQEGVLGKVKIIDRIYSASGVELRTEELSRETITEPVKKIIKVGTKVVEKKDEISKVDIPFEKKTELDPTLPKGETKMKQEGVKGLKEVKEKVTYTNGNETAREMIDEKILEKPVDEITLVGTLVVNDRVEKEEISFETIIKEDPDKYEDFREETDGVPGEKEVTYKDYSGDLVEKRSELVSEKVVKEPVNKVITIGTKKIFETKDSEEVFDIDFKVIRKEDNTLKVGEEKVLTEGVKGQKKVYYKELFEKGEFVKKTVDKTEIIKDPIDQVILVGTLKPVVPTEPKPEEPKPIAEQKSQETVKPIEEKKPQEEKQPTAQKQQVKNPNKEDVGLETGLRNWSLVQKGVAFGLFSVSLILAFAIYYKRKKSH